MTRANFGNLAGVMKLTEAQGERVRRTLSMKPVPIDTSDEARRIANSWIWERKGEPNYEGRPWGYAMQRRGELLKGSASVLKGYREFSDVFVLDTSHNAGNASAFCNVPLSAKNALELTDEILSRKLYGLRRGHEVLRKTDDGYEAVHFEESD